MVNNQLFDSEKTFILKNIYKEQWVVFVFFRMETALSFQLFEFQYLNHSGFPISTIFHLRVLLQFFRCYATSRV